MSFLITCIWLLLNMSFGKYYKRKRKKNDVNKNGFTKLNVFNSFFNKRMIDIGITFVTEMLDKLLKEDRTLQEIVASKHLSQLGCSQTLDVPSAQISSKPKSDKLAACRVSD